MALYFHVEDGQIQDGPRALLTAWRNISGLHHLSPAKLKALGWLPEERIGFEPFDPATQVRAGPVNDVRADKVVSTYQVRDKTAQELDDEKDALANVIMNEPGLVAVVKYLNDGSIVPGANVPMAALKAAVRAKL